MKIINTAVLLTLLALPALCRAERESINLDRGWKFHRGEVAAAQQPETSDSAWETVNLPHDFQISQPWVEPAPDELPDLDNPVANVKSRLSARGFKECGTGWYRLHFCADSLWKGRRAVLDFGGIMLTGDVWVNGVRAGGTDYGYLGFETDITGLLRYGADNVVAVRADTGSPENSRWYTGGGLFRGVKLILTDPALHFARHPLCVITDTIAPGFASIRLQAEISAPGKRDKSPLRLRYRICDASGTAVAENTVELPFSPRQATREYIADSITIPSPRLWDCDHPHLYRAEAELLRPDGTAADSTAVNFGIRKIEFSPDFGFRLNGKKVLLKGIANHHTLGALGAAAYPRAIEKRIRLLKEFGFNHIRTSHNPYSEEFLDLCDRYGILVVDELYDKWLQQYAGGRRDWMELWPRDLPEWVKRDRNHPSVIMWSLGNELQLLWEIPYADWGVTPYRMQKALLDRFDRSRPVTVAMHPRGRHQATDSLPAPLAMQTDIQAYNYRYMYFPGDGRRFPWMIFYQSEASAAAMGQNFFGMDLGRVTGLAYWGMIDYLGESGGWPAKGWTQGAFTISLEPKPTAWFLRSYFKPDDPVVHIGIVDSDRSRQWNGINIGSTEITDHWNRQPGDTLSLYTYTNADEVELRLNGRSLGRCPNDTADSGKRNRIRWDKVVYAPGTLEAVAYKGGKEVARHRIQTAAKAVRLNAEPDNPDWRADGCDLQHVSITATDSRGITDPRACCELTFTVEGEAEIAGVINGDMTSSEPFTGNRRSLCRGKAAVILRSTDRPGEVTLTVSAPGMKDKKIKMRTL